MDTLNIDSKSQLAKLLATENITVQQNNVKTASFDVVNRILTLPIFKTESKDVTDMLVAHECAHALYTPENGWKKIADDNELRAYVNVLEDCRIDAKIQKKYPGVVNNYLNGFEILNRKNFFGLKDKDYDKDLMLIDKINIFYKSSKKLLFNFSNADKLWLKKVDELKTFNDVIKLAKQLLDWQKKEVKKMKKLPDFDNHILVENYNLKNKENDSKDSKDIDGDGNKDDNKDSKEEKDKQDATEGKTESESKQDKPAVGDKTAKDENSGGGAVGAGGDMQLGSITNNWFEGHKEKLLDTETSYNYRKIPKPKLNKIIKSNKEFISDMKKSFVNDGNVKNYYPYLKKEYKKFINESKKTIMYLVKEFEMKKAATAYKRSTQDKTGVIDPLKLHSYKFNDDIFKRLTILPDAKNHGMMMLLDWSGSMSDCIFKTVQQTIQLVQFCSKVNIPFELYFFSSEMDKTDGSRISKDFNYKPGDMAIDNVKLVNVASHKLKKQKLDESLMYLYHLAMYYEHRYCWRSSRDPFAYDRPDSVHIPSEYFLGSTPLNEALIVMLKLVPLFKNKYKIEKMNLITLTDGGGNYGCSETMQYDSESKQLIGTHPENQGSTDVMIYKKKYHSVKDEFYGYRSTGITGTLLNMLRDYHNITTIGFYLIKRIRRWETDMYFRPQNIKDYYKRDEIYLKNRQKFNKDKVCAVPQKGYDDYYIVNAKDMKVQNTDLEGINDTMKTGKIKQLFSKSMKGRITSRVLLNKFI